jgi:uncharacterized protein YecT (DUF1311 family)
MKKLVVMAMGVLAVPPIEAAGFDCNKASLPIEKAICRDQTLSQADDQMNDAYTYLLAQCRDVATHADLSGTQRRWLAGVRKDFGDLSPEALDRLNAAYRDRNDVLARLLAACNPEHGPAKATVTMAKDAVNGYVLPFVQTTPPQPGWRINKVLFGRYDGRPPLELSELNAFFAKHKPTDQQSGVGEFTVVSNKGNILVMDVRGSDCSPDAPRCSPYDMQYRFDIRTGRIVQTDELYTEQGAHSLAHTLKEKLLGLAGSRLAALSKVDADAYGDQYRQCMDNWVKVTEVSVEASFTADGRMQYFGLGNCSSHTPYGPDPEQAEGMALDNLSLTVALPEIRPYLSAYGRSLLLGEGDVREPIADAPQECKLQGGLPVRKDDSAFAPGVQASAGEEHYLMLMPEGRLWGWGEAHYGELGSSTGRVPEPVLQEGEYAQIGAGQFYTAGLGRDGSLWTWGSNYENRLGDGTTKPSEHPVRIGDGFVSLKVESYGAMALKRDGTVWGWGGAAKTPQQLMADVKQIEYGPAGERLMLKNDGSLWALGGFNPGGAPYDATRPRLIGHGFARLAVRHGDLAYKADGSLWAWSGQLAASFHLDESDENSVDRPVNIGSGFINVKVGGSHWLNLATLKADGSLWMVKKRGTVTRLAPVGCGYVDMVMGEQYLLTLKQDGRLEVWGSWPEQARNEHKPRAPAESAGQPALPGYADHVLLGAGYTRLFPVGDLWGNLGAKAIVLRNDNSVWLFSPPWPRDASGPRDWFRQVPFPKQANVGK